ncbi:MAG: NusG domain II-containing protein [Ruminococcus sp.]
MHNKTISENRKFFRLADLAVIALVLTAFAAGVAMLCHFSSSGTRIALITVNGREYKSIALDEVTAPYELTVEGECTVLVQISSEGVRFVSSECDDKLCINTGLVDRPGESAVCLPARVAVKLICEDNSGEIDAVVG